MSKLAQRILSVDDKDLIIVAITILTGMAIFSLEATVSIEVIKMAVPGLLGMAMGKAA